MLYVGKTRYIDKKIVKDPISVCAFIADKFLAYSYEKVSVEDIIKDNGKYYIKKQIGNRLPKYICITNDTYYVYEIKDTDICDISTFLLLGINSQKPNISFLGTNFNQSLNS